MKRIDLALAALFALSITPSSANFPVSVALAEGVALATAFARTVRHESPTPSTLRAGVEWGMLHRSPPLHLRRGRRLMGPRTAEGRYK